ncbi:hypothetical protein IQB77_23325, partial [Leptospira interrogans serovar Pomona]|nr:hypothetical protein [Leptospira interrogans serovar Pomona]
MRLSDVQESRALISKRIIVLSIWICCTVHFSCRTLESFFETVILTGGVDSTELNFFTKYTPLENLIRTNAGFKTPKN